MASNDDDIALSASDPERFLLEIQKLSEEERQQHLQEYRAACHQQAEAIFEALT